MDRSVITSNENKISDACRKASVDRRWNGLIMESVERTAGRRSLHRMVRSGLSRTGKANRLSEAPQTCSAACCRRKNAGILLLIEPCGLILILAGRKRKKQSSPHRSAKTEPSSGKLCRREVVNAFDSLEVGHVRANREYDRAQARRSLLGRLQSNCGGVWINDLNGGATGEQYRRRDGCKRESKWI